MKVYALIGESGSGKSHRAAEIQFEHGINYLIDDGLLISNRKKIAGSSAKREKTKVMAVKRAIFFVEEHRKEVSLAIKNCDPDKILVLGTSYKMISRICQALDIPKPDKVIYIRDVASEDDISEAKKMRNEFGRHIIPLPEIEVEKDFPFYWLNPFYSMIKRQNKKRKVEKTIVRPHFSSLGKLVISENVIHQIVKEEKKNYDSIRKIINDHVNIDDEGVDIEIQLMVKVVKSLPGDLYNFKTMIQKSIVENTGLLVNRLDIEIKRIDYS